LRKIAIAIAVSLASLTCFGQEPQVVVEQVTGEVVQVSTAADSPNVTRITGNVTINYYRCSNVTYCGPSQVSSAIGGYSVAGSSPNWYIPPTVTDSGFTSESVTTEIQPWILGSSLKSGVGAFGVGTDSAATSSFGLALAIKPVATEIQPLMWGSPRKSGVDSFGAGTDSPDTSGFGLGFAIKPYPSTELKLIGSTLSDDGISSSSPINKFTSTSYSFAATSPYSITSQLIGSDTSNMALLIGAAFASDQSGIESGLTAHGASDYNYPFGMQTTHMWVDHASSTHPYEVWAAPSESSYGGSTIFPDLTSPPAGTGTLGLSSGFGQTGSRYKSATGFDADSLAKQLADLAEQKRTIVGWTLLTEEDSKTGGAQ
jgi:hypothetical protein